MQGILYYYSHPKQNYEHHHCSRHPYQHLDTILVSCSRKPTEEEVYQASAQERPRIAME